MRFFGPPDIGKLFAEKNVRGLIRALSYRKDKSIRRDAAGALGWIDDSRAVDALLASLEDEEPEVRRAILIALGNIRDVRATACIIEVMKFDAEREIRTEAAHVLGVLQGAGAVAALSETLKNDMERTVRAAAAAALGMIGDAHAVDPLMNSSHEDEQSVCVAAIEALGVIGDSKAVDTLIGFMTDVRKEVRQTSAESLGKIRNARALNVLCDALNDCEPEVSLAAAVAIGAIGEREPVGRLIDMLQSEAVNPRHGAATALGILGDKRAVPPLIAVLSDNSETVRYAAAAALANIGGLAVLDVLLTHYENHKNIRAIAQIIMRANKEKRDEILSDFAKQDPAFAEEVKSYLIVLEDLVFLDDRSIQRVLRETEAKNLALALRVATKELKEAFFRNMTDRAVSLIKEEMEFMGPVRLKDVEMAHITICESARILEEKGEITFSRRGGEDEIVI